MNDYPHFPQPTEADLRRQSARKNEITDDEVNAASQYYFLAYGTEEERADVYEMIEAMEERTHLNGQTIITAMHAAFEKVRRDALKNKADGTINGDKNAK
jgi:hypothetical protein